MFLKISLVRSGAIHCALRKSYNFNFSSEMS